MVIERHDGTVDNLLGGLSAAHRPACSCGWSGDLTIRPHDSERQLDEHIKAAETLPVEWPVWRLQWGAWLDANSHRLGPSSYDFGRRSICADEILGQWSTGWCAVELSEVRMMGKRFIGVTFGSATSREAILASTFRELEALLWPDG